MKSLFGLIKGDVIGDSNCFGQGKEGLLRNILCFSVSILFAPSVCFSSHLSITINGPYASGVVSIQTGSYHYDTITFSNAISLSFFDQTTMIPEPVKLDHGIAINGGRNLAKAGFKYVQGATWKKSSADSTLEIYDSKDTVWPASTTFPDSITTPDSLFDGTNGSPQTCIGKWLYFTDGDLTFGNWVGRIENFNNIIYIQTSQNKMKLQISNIFINTPFGWNSKVDSLRLIWAVDSLGNGQFKEFTTIKGFNNPFSRTHRQPSFSLLNGNELRFIQSASEPISLFDIQGKRILMSTRPILSYGIFIYKTEGNILP